MAEILHFEILRKHGQTNTQTHKQTHKQTHRHGHYNTSPSPYGGEVTIHTHQQDLKITLFPTCKLDLVWTNYL